MLEWMKDAYTHCKYGSQEWCEGYLKHARNELVRLYGRVDELLEANNRYQQEARDARAEVVRLKALLTGKPIEVGYGMTLRIKESDFDWSA